MLFKSPNLKSEEINTIQNFINEFDSDIVTSSPEDTDEVSNVSKYITSLVSNCYQKSIEDIENTKIGNRITRKKSLKQVMRESFFYGANRFGNNFIA